MIRPYAPGDVEAVVRVFRASCFPAHGFLPKAFLEKSVADLREKSLVTFRTLVVEDAGIRAFLCHHDAFIDALFVDHVHQSHGHGKALLDALKMEASMIRLGVFGENTRAIRFYQREAFYAEKVGTHAPTNASYVWLKWTK